MKLTLKFLLLTSLSPALFAQLTPAQKVNEFHQLAALFSKRYAFYEWKRDALGFDGLSLSSWIERVNSSKDDLEFFEICAEYVAGYKDSHTGFELPSEFAAYLGFTVDIYEDKILIDSIDRKLLPELDFPFQVGDELVSIDDKPVAELMANIVRMVGEGNPITAKRTAAAMLVYRIQAYLPRAHEIGEYASLAVRRQVGALETYTVKWQKSGTPYTAVGPVPDPKTASFFNRKSVTRETTAPAALTRLRESEVYRARRSKWAIGVGKLAPIFAMPSTFIQRLGNGRYDSFYSGLFDYGGKTIAYLRVPDFDYFSESQLQVEIRFYKKIADGLIVDLMRNPGGYACPTEDLLSYFMPNGFHSLGASWRVTWSDILDLEYELESAPYYGGTETEIARLKEMLDAARQAYAQNRGMTPAMPLCSLSLDLAPAVDSYGNVLAFEKPVMLLVDEFSASAAELFSAVMQDEKRALIYGARTAGAGGSVQSAEVGFYMEAYARLARTIAIRKSVTTTSEYPAMPFIENIGIVPDRSANYMTVDNLTNKGKTFVEGFLAAMVEHINASQPAAQ